jgi:hypothetical protein
MFSTVDVKQRVLVAAKHWKGCGPAWTVTTDSTRTRSARSTGRHSEVHLHLVAAQEPHASILVEFQALSGPSFSAGCAVSKSVHSVLCENTSPQLV